MDDTEKPDLEQTKAASAGSNANEEDQAESVNPAPLTPGGTGQVVEAEEAALKQTNGHTGPKSSNP
jgi:hypothetical protein